MFVSEVLQLAFVTVAAFLSAAIVFYFANRLGKSDTKVARDIMREAENSVVFLFDDTALVDATQSARAMLPAQNGTQSDWDGFVSIFGPHFPYLRQKLLRLAEIGKTTLVSPDNPQVQLEAEYWDGLVRLAFFEKGVSDPQRLAAQISMTALESETATLRALAEDSPQLIWKQDATGKITWANNAYLALADRLVPAQSGKVAAWPPTPLFEDLDQPTEHENRLVRRLTMTDPLRQTTLWFEVTSLLRGAETIHFAVDATAAVLAEDSRRGFVQTLGKTFAELSIGLAIFDNRRRLMTFNPALTNLTGLQFEFLSSRPLIHTMLDRLREARMLPEPKNYVTWREEIAALESAAKNGTYMENWDLPGGQTYRVTGRPHPDGAVALLFEDISAEVSLTRRFRAEIETARAVLDGVDEAIAVFSQNGAMTMSNAAYGRLWSLDQNAIGYGTITSVEATRVWQENCAPSSIWVFIREYISGFGERAPLTEIITFNDGRQFQCRVSPLPGAGSVVSFRQITEQVSKPALPATSRKRLALTG